ncbi:MAG TPA: hypothetical protein VF755_19355 [Catenuloplanes sp.]
MSERDDVPAAQETNVGQDPHLTDDVAQEVSPGAGPAADGAAASTLGLGSRQNVDSALPQGAPDPSIGPD